MKLRERSRGNVGRRGFREGFTLTEVLIVLGIFAILTSAGLAFGMDSYRGYSFRHERDLVISILYTARSRAMNNMNESAHGVYFGPANYVLFRGNSYAARVPGYDQEIPRSPAVEITGMTEAVFAQLTGETAPGTLTVIGGGRIAVFAINHEGGITW